MDTYQSRMAALRDGLNALPDRSTPGFLAVIEYWSLHCGGADIVAPADWTQAQVQALHQIAAANKNFAKLR